MSKPQLTTYRYNELLSQSIIDLKDDFEELLWLIESLLVRLNKFLRELNNTKKYIPSSVYNDTVINLNYFASKYFRYSKDLQNFHNQAKNEKHSELLYTKLSRAKNIYYNLIRTNQGLIGSLITSTDWQSPSFLHTNYSQAGRQTGKIIGTINDYKRDGRLDNEEFEKLYRREYIDSPFKFLIKVFITNSGMAAFSTILNFLIMEKKIKNKVIMGKSSYFENKQLMLKSLDNNVIQVDEFKTEEIINIIDKEKPSVIYFDSLCNTKSVPVPDLTKILKYLLNNNTQDLYVLIDNTGLSTYFQPMRMVIGNRKKVHLIVFESLNKYYQFGLDRVTGGIIAAYGKDVGKLIEYREHLGTNIIDSSVYSLPIPNRKFLEKRLLRLSRNVKLISSALEEYIKNKKNCPINKIVFPGLSTHLSNKWWDSKFCGSFFSIDFKEKYQKINYYQKFIKTVKHKAAKRNVEIIGGTSFGLNTTRIYLTATRSDYCEPFVRISAGTETRLQLEKLKEVFMETIDDLS